MGSHRVGHDLSDLAAAAATILVFFFLTHFTLSNSHPFSPGNEVCYDSIGCFSDSEPRAGTAIRPLKILPWNPEKIGTCFLLYTNKNPNNFQILLSSDPSTTEASNFQTDKKTRFTIHGFTDKGDESWLVDMCKNMFEVEEVNCICMDWKKGSQTTYTQAANTNVRVVGAQMSNYSCSPSQVHLIGHSLGAHVAGEAGRKTPGLGRITGLDPVQANFEGTPEEVRHDPSDAGFVDVIHTDVAALIPFTDFGVKQQVGHLDFFPNGREEMSRFRKNALFQIVDLDGIWTSSFASSQTWDFVACNYLRSYRYYSESTLNPNGLTEYPCACYRDFESNKCFPCPDEGRPQMGHYADRFAGKTREEQQQFFLNTGDSSRFARWRYGVSVTLSGRTATGQIKVALFGNKGNTRQYNVFNIQDFHIGIIKPGPTLSSEFDADIDVGTTEKVKFLWNNNVVNPTLSKVGAAKIIVQKGEEKTE
uniref:Triacylglycerol lipase n=1 Tax=Moschus moschiferus TaxID=68415 RepID=A0A8C6DXA4_MOSMO